MDESTLAAQMAAMEQEMVEIRKEWAQVLQLAGGEADPLYMTTLGQGGDLPAPEPDAVRLQKDVTALMWDVLSLKSDVFSVREVQLKHSHDIGSLKSGMSVLLQGQQAMFTMLDRLIARGA